MQSWYGEAEAGARHTWLRLVQDPELRGYGCEAIRNSWFVAVNERTAYLIFLTAKPFKVTPGYLIHGIYRLSLVRVMREQEIAHTSIAQIRSGLIKLTQISFFLVFRLPSPLQWLTCLAATLST